ncbi:hypothetical protein CFP56_000360 [Quercus suber]|uniref:Uncharacterized protein n=1 Tax=Quercus suber TaxID=58331 RepID=A0AAW0M8R2_QUESU
MTSSSAKESRNIGPTAWRALHFESIVSLSHRTQSNQGEKGGGVFVSQESEKDFESAPIILGSVGFVVLLVIVVLCIWVVVVVCMDRLREACDVCFVGNGIDYLRNPLGIDQIHLVA